MSSIVTAGQQLAYIEELMEMIFLNLDYYNLLHAQEVCKDWKEYVERSKGSQELLFKRPLQIIEGENPLFEEPIAAAQRVRVPHIGPRHGIPTKGWNNYETHHLMALDVTGYTERLNLGHKIFFDNPELFYADSGTVDLGPYFDAIVGSPSPVS
jgi:hypothetical protein